MRTYYGTKRIQAEPEVRDGIAGYKVVYEDGYTSWSPGGAFSKAYEPDDAMGFEGALCAMKEGRRVARTGWNGVGMWVAHGSGGALEAKDFWNRHSRRWAEQLETLGQRAHVSDYFLMKTGKGDIQMGWAPSPEDILGNRWRIVPEEQP
jgi:hypothetical protein